MGLSRRMASFVISFPSKRINKYCTYSTAVVYSIHARFGRSGLREVAV